MPRGLAGTGFDEAALCALPGSGHGCCSAARRPELIITSGFTWCAGLAFDVHVFVFQHPSAVLSNASAMQESGRSWMISFTSACRGWGAWIFKNLNKYKDRCIYLRGGKRLPWETGTSLQKHVKRLKKGSVECVIDQCCFLQQEAVQPGRCREKLSVVQRWKGGSNFRRTSVRGYIAKNTCNVREGCPLWSRSSYLWKLHVVWLMKKHY